MRLPGRPEQAVLRAVPALGSSESTLPSISKPTEPRSCAGTRFLPELRRACSDLLRYQPRPLDPGAGDSPPAGVQFTKVQLEKTPKRCRRLLREPGIDQRFHVRVVLGLRARVRVTTPLMPPNVAVERRADMPQLVKDSDQLFAQVEILKPRQIEREDLQIFGAGRIKEPLNRVLPPAALCGQAPVLKPQRRE